VLPGRGLRRFDRPPWPDGSAPATAPGTAEQGSSGI
jgi:hypothetical protein